ncbi:MAG: hypothetical protein JWO39_303 [Gemmatimonadetes bacterium]|jgi:hypothetical protein|nr:hypothetical protein [Gemmatimonadota bacterium]
MTRPIETAVECRQELIALSGSYQQVGWKLKIESAFPRWRDRSEQRLAASVSLKASTEFARLVRKPRHVQNETWIDVVAMHLAFLEELIHDVQIHPEDYGASVIAHERRVTSAAREAAKNTPRKVPLTEPEEITLAKLVHRPSATLVAIYFGSLLAAFALGVRVAHVPAVVRIVGPVLGIAADTAKAPPAAPR